MVCMTSCAIAIIFLIAMMYMCLFSDGDEVAQEFKNSLSDDQKTKYNEIVSERRMLYLWGYFLGFILSIVYIVLFKPKLKSDLQVMCIVGGVTFLTAYFFYILYPKKPLMVIELDEKEKREQWAKVYRTMQYNYHIGLVLGIFAVMLTGKGLCKTSNSSSS